MEHQIRCFGCKSVIITPYAHFERYKKDLGLSTDDALDKAQIVADCCRMTVMGMTNVAERVRAAGRPVTRNGHKLTVDISEYPSRKIERRETVKVQQAFDENLSFEPVKITDYVSEERPIPLETVIRARAKPQTMVAQVIEPIVKYGISYLENVNWNMSNPDTFPYPDALDSQFVKDPEQVVSYSIPLVKSARVLFKTRPGSTLRQVLIDMATFILEPRQLIADQSSSWRNPSSNLMLVILKAMQESRYPSIFEVLFGHDRVRKIESINKQLTVSFVLPKPVENRHLNVYSSRANNTLTGKVVSNATLNEGQELTIEFEDETTLDVSHFIVHTRNEKSETDVDVIIGTAVLEADYINHGAERGMLILFEGQIVLQCLSDVNIGDALYPIIVL